MALFLFVVTHLRSTIKIILVPHPRNWASGRVGSRRLSERLRFQSEAFVFYTLYFLYSFVVLGIGVLKNQSAFYVFSDLLKNDLFLVCYANGWPSGPSRSHTHFAPLRLYLRDERRLHFAGAGLRYWGALVERRERRPWRGR